VETLLIATTLAITAVVHGQALKTILTTLKEWALMLSGSHLL
jgi:hypothetical protein